MHIHLSLACHAYHVCTITGKMHKMHSLLPILTQMLYYNYIRKIMMALLHNYTQRNIHVKQWEFISICMHTVYDINY